MPTATPTETPTGLPTLMQTFPETPAETPTPLSTETATETPTAETTQLPTATPPETVTPTGTAVMPTPTETLLAPTASATLTETPTALPPEPPLTLLLMDTFDAGELYLWTLGAGWSLAASENGLALAVTGSDAPVTFVHHTLEDAAVQARFLLSSGLARMSLRQSDAGSYTALLDAGGQVALYRGARLMGAATVTPTVPGVWRMLRLSAIGSLVRVAVDGVEVIAALDPAPLPAGTLSFGALGSGESAVLVDDVTLSIPAMAGVKFESPTPSPTPMITMTPNVYELSRLEERDTTSLNALADPGVVIFKYVSDVAGLKNVILQARTNPDNTYVIHLASGRYIFTEVDDMYSANFVDLGKVIIVGSESYALNLPPFDPGLLDTQKVIIERADGIPYHMDLFYISSGGSLTLYNVVVRHGGGTSRWGGGGFVNWGSLNIYNSIIEDNQVYAYGGAIFNNQSGQITAINTVFRNNLTQNGIMGGAVSSRSYAPVNFSCVTFQDNQGGAIYREANTGSIVINNSNFINNTAAAGYGAVHNWPSVPIIDARSNWWNADSNPPTIQGMPNAVSSGVDYSNRRRVEAPLNCPVPPVPTPRFTNLEFWQGGQHEAYQGVMFWAIYMETSGDESDSGSGADVDYGTFADFLFDAPYCSPGANPPSNNAAEAPTPNGRWYIRHCPEDHRAMFAQTMLNGFLNMERRGYPIFQYTQNYTSAIHRPANLIWHIKPCEKDANGKDYETALKENQAPEWLYAYMTCLSTSPSVDPASFTVERVRRAYNSTILPQIRASAIPDFYNQNTGDPTDGAYSNLDLNFGGNTVFACVGGCYLPNGTLVVTYTADQAVKGIIFATPAAQITQQNILDAYNQYIQYTSSYGPNYFSVIQPVLNYEINETTHEIVGYTWSARVYQRSQNMDHFPRYR